MVKAAFFIVLVFLFFTATFSLQRSGYSTYNAYMNPRNECPGPHRGRCCPYGCSAIFRYFGRWTTEDESPPTTASCQLHCEKHHEKCLDDCKCLFSSSTVRGKKGCNCALDRRSFLIASGNCTKMCDSAFGHCKENCVRARPTHCLTATTIVRFRTTVKGTCQNDKCSRLISPLEDAISDRELQSVCRLQEVNTDESN